MAPTDFSKKIRHLFRNGMKKKWIKIDAEIVNLISARHFQFSPHHYSTIEIFFSFSNKKYNYLFSKALLCSQILSLTKFKEK